MIVDISDSAQVYLKDLLEKQECEGIGIRIFITDPGTPRAETCIAFCRPGEEKEGDEELEYNGFKAYLENNSLRFLEDSFVDYGEDRMGGQLTIKAPNAKLPQISEDSSLEDKINYVLYNEINPQLASHGGMVSLETVVEEEEGKIAILRFGGGCQGCGMVDTTLKDGVEKTLLESIEELHEVRDITDHSMRDNAYY